ncbi:TRAP transporter small permease [Marasmitruncus massiliensis]|uniref:TRAP transporter small permease n=1 Tax=Marasmitruncus massiliensis TaxID=1944642 RepID=UPI000C7D06AB|nr:TRAP transporter small permease [Marasmitruncus massiliensis]
MKGNEKKNLLRRISRSFDMVESTVALLSFLAMFIFVLITIIYRYLLHLPLLWTEESARYMMITGIFFGMSIAVRENAHLGVDIFINLLPKQSKKSVRLFSDIITLIAYLAILYSTYLFMAKTFAGNQTSPALKLPMYMIYGVIYAGFLLATIEQIIKIILPMTEKGFPTHEEVEK